MRTRRVLAALGGVVVAGLAWTVLPVAAVELDEGGVPSNRQAHLPSDVTVLDQGEECGSGGCWRVLTLAWPDHAPGELAARLGVPGADGEVCRAVSLLDRRRACVDVGPVAGQAASTGLLEVRLRWRRPLGL